MGGLFLFRLVKQQQTFVCSDVNPIKSEGSGVREGLVHQDEDG